MTDQDALLAAVLANPADDTPRLVYADWLDDHGGEVECPECAGDGHTKHRSADSHWIRSFNYRLDCSKCHCSGRVSNLFAERAEFIRVQCELAKPHTADCALNTNPRAVHCTCKDFGRVNALRRRERGLWVRLRDGVRREAFGDSQASVTIDAFDANIVVPQGLVSRGFVSSISCDLETFLGGPCERCIGWTAQHNVAPYDQCPECHGNRNYRTPGLAPALFAVAPIEEVRLTDRQLTLADDGFGRGWTWSRRRFDPSDPYTIPDELHESMPTDQCQQTPLAAGYRRWDKQDTALAALSAACVAYGREMTKKGQPT